MFQLFCRKPLYESDPKWQENYHLWLESFFRKICLRAREVQWQALTQDFDGVVVGDVMCLPPRKKSEREILLGKMNALTQVRGECALPAFEGPSADVTIIVNEDLEMGAGKVIAQVCHGALREPKNGESIAIVGSDIAGFEKSGSPCECHNSNNPRYSVI